MVGFVGAGGIGDAIHDAISFFHYGDLATFLLVLWLVVISVEVLGDYFREKVMRWDARGGFNESPKVCLDGNSPEGIVIKPDFFII